MAYKSTSHIGASPVSVIGKTTLGNHIHADKGADHPAYAKFTSGEHFTAAAVHSKVAKDLYAKAARLGGSQTVQRQASQHSHFAATHRSMLSGSGSPHPTTPAPAAAAMPQRMAASMTARKSLDCPDINDPTETELARTVLEAPDRALNGDDVNLFGDQGPEGDGGVEVGPFDVVLEDTGEADYIKALLEATYKGAKPRARDFFKDKPDESNGCVLAD